MSKQQTRREFLKKTSMSGASAAISLSVSPAVFGGTAKKKLQPVLLGGDPVRTKPWPAWPQWDIVTDEPKVVEVLRSGKWSRAGVVTEFEKQWAQTIGVKRALTTVNGTNALITSLAQLDIGGGDEVIIPAYTFIATLSAVLATGAMPVFADIDAATFQIDPEKIEAKINERTRAILPVHICGLPADMEKIMAIAKKNNLFVVEDACQSWLSEINHQKTGTFGNAGCFSFQNSKNIPIGEGGAIVSNDEAFMDRCYSYHNFGLKYGTAGSRPGTKLRMTEYQAAIGLVQLKRLDIQTTIRNNNASFLRNKLIQIPGIIPYTLYKNVTRASFHLFPFRYQKDAFNGLSRSGFIEAMKAEGIPCSSGYAPLNTAENISSVFQTKNYKKMYPPQMLDVHHYILQNQCSVNDRICNEEAVWFSQNMLLGTEADMLDIVAAIEKIQQHNGKLKEKLR